MTCAPESGQAGCEAVCTNKRCWSLSRCKGCVNGLSNVLEMTSQNTGMLWLRLFLFKSQTHLVDRHRQKTHNPWLGLRRTDWIPVFTCLVLSQQSCLVTAWATLSKGLGCRVAGQGFEIDEMNCNVMVTSGMFAPSQKWDASVSGARFENALLSMQSAHAWNVVKN